MYENGVEADGSNLNSGLLSPQSGSTNNKIQGLCPFPDTVTIKV